MKRRLFERTAFAIAIFATGSGPALAETGFDSGSSGEDGAFTPTVDTALELPEDGIFHFTNVVIPEGVTIRFDGNRQVTILASGDVDIAGTLDLSGSWSPPVGAAGDGNVGDDGLPGLGGPGGFDGGLGGEPADTREDRPGGAGIGPGGGGGGVYSFSRKRSGAGGSFATVGSSGSNVTPGQTYGSEVLLPLIGGSGGGGGFGGPAFHGSGGGGGGGAILIAANGTISVTGEILAVGGSSGDVAGSGIGAAGGGGSGGAIRLVADRITGNGTLQATGGIPGSSVDSGTTNPTRQGNGGDGRIRLEANVFERTAATAPDFSFGEPSVVFVPGLPGLRIDSVAGIPAPDFPTGRADIVLPEDTPDTVSVVFRTHGVPVGNTVSLRVTPASGEPITVVSPALTGDMESATAQVEVALPDGPSTLLAETTYTIVDDGEEEFGALTGGEPVAHVRVRAGMDGRSDVTLITESGREVPVHGRLPAMPQS